MVKIEGQYTVIFWGDAEPPTKLVVQHRNPNRKFGGGMRTGTGGHFDAEKDASMLESARRELTEEVPELADSPLIPFARCRVTTNAPDGTTRYKALHYFWAGVLPTDKPLPECDPREGWLEWQPAADLLDPQLNVFPTTLAVLQEWSKRGYRIGLPWTQYVHGHEDGQGITRDVSTDKVLEGLQELVLDWKIRLPNFVRNFHQF